eukprot:gene4509-5525_t
MSETQALREAARNLGKVDGSVRVSWPEVQQCVTKVLDRAFALTDEKFALDPDKCSVEKRWVACQPDILTGSGRFQAPGLVVVQPPEEGPALRVKANVIFVTTGSMAMRIPGLPWGVEAAEGWLFDSDSIAGIGRVPQHLVVQGGGVIAVEYAFIMHRLGASVTVIMREDSVLQGKGVDICIR